MITKKPRKPFDAEPATLDPSAAAPVDYPRSHDDLTAPHDIIGLEESGRPAASLSSDLKDTASSVSRAVKEQVSQITSEIGHELGKSAEGQKERGVEAMRTFARAVGTAAGEFEEQSPIAARYARDAAQRIEGLSSNISGRKVSELIESAASLAKSRPGLFFTGVVVAGFALSRFVKSSAAHDRSDPLRDDLASRDL